MRRVLAALFALALSATAAPASAQYCWDTVCAAGTPAADCWRAWCSEGWSYPAYPYQAPGWYRADAAPLRYSAADPYRSPIQFPFAPTTRLQGCSTGRALDWAVWGC